MNDFAHPRSLWLLAILPLGCAWIVRGRRRRAADWTALGQGGRLAGVGDLGWVAAMACLIVALAGPRWGRAPAPPLPPGHDMVLLVDVSRSMGAEDAVPTRLEVGLAIGESLIEALGRGRGNRVGVVAFAGRGVVRCHVTDDLAAATEALRRLRPGTVRPGGTDLGAALDAASDAFDEEDHAEGRTVVLVSDGEDLVGNWSAALGRIRARGVVVHAVAVGDPERGYPVPSGRGAGVLTYEGAPVVSRRDDRPLAAVAAATGGALIPAGRASVDLGALYEARIAPVARQRREVLRPTERTERFPVFVFAAVVLGLSGSRPRAPRWTGRGRWIVVLGGALAALGAGDVGVDRGATTAAGAVRTGRTAYASGRFAEALAAFEHAIALEPNGAIPRYNAAAALFQLARYDAALDRYREARDRGDAALGTKIDFALGNTALARGDIPEALDHYDRCLTSTAMGADLVAVRRDAAINRRFAEEQPRRPPVPPEPNGAPPAANRRRGPAPGAGDPSPEGGSDPDRATAPPRADSGAPSPSNPRGAGGAGGTGPSPPLPGSPEARLARALENVREARRGRLDEETTVPDENRKDW